MTKRSISWSDVQSQCDIIVQQLSHDEIQIDTIIGLSRGGLVPATILSHNLSIREVLVHGYHSYDEDQRIRDPENYHGVMYQDVLYDLMKGISGKNILIVDDLCDEGVTMSGLVNRLSGKFHRGVVEFKTATLYCKDHSSFKPDYVGEHCGKEWLEFPWEINI